MDARAKKRFMKNLKATTIVAQTQDGLIARDPRSARSFLKELAPNQYTENELHSRDAPTPSIGRPHLLSICHLFKREMTK